MADCLSLSGAETGGKSQTKNSRQGRVTERIWVKRRDVKKLMLSLIVVIQLYLKVTVFFFCTSCAAYMKSSLFSRQFDLKQKKDKIDF